MPELPEVETIARGLDRRVKGDTIERIWLGEKPEPLKSSPQEIAEAVEGTRIESVRRVGKQMVIDLSRDTKRGKREVSARGAKLARPILARPIEAQWIIHLGMTGRMLVTEGDTERAPHTHAVAQLKSGRELHFVDPRRFGRLSVVRIGNEGTGFRGTGVEPLTVDTDDFAALFRRRKTPIKSALLNQKLLHGVGNIYADEALFRAKVRPTRRAASLTRAELERLRVALQEVLREAIKLGGSSVSDYVDAEGNEGFFQLRHNVYLRTGKPCRRCGTPIKRTTVAGRGTHYCPHCQH